MSAGATVGNRRSQTNNFEKSLYQQKGDHLNRPR